MLIDYFCKLKKRMIAGNRRNREKTKTLYHDILKNYNVKCSILVRFNNTTNINLL